MRAPSLDWICIFLGFGTLTLRFSVTILISSAWSSNGDCLIRSFTSVTKKTLRGARIQIVVKLLTLPYVSVYALHSHAQNVFAWADSFGASHEEDHKYPNRRASLAKVFGSAQRKPCLSLHQFELSTGCAESTRSKGSKLAAVERPEMKPCWFGLSRFLKLRYPRYGIALRVWKKYWRSGPPPHQSFS